MIQALHIRNLAVIEDLQFEFSPGLNVLTGETGAGKSIILSALGLVLGERASAEMVRTGATKAFVEAQINLEDGDSELRRFLEDEDLIETDETEIILSRQVTASGRSRCQANGRLVPVSILKRIGNMLVDIHGQHEHQSLLRPELHLNLVDGYGGLTPQCGLIRQCYQELQVMRTDLHKIEQERKERLREKELLEFQVGELDEANLQEGEDESLEIENQRLSNAQKLSTTAASLHSRLRNDNGILDTLKSLRSELLSLCGLDKSLEPIHARLEGTFYELEDIADQLRTYRDQVEYNPQRMEEVESRLDSLYRLKRKYGETIRQILDYQDEAAQTLRELSVSSKRIAELKQTIQEKLDYTRDRAMELSQQRQGCAAELQACIERELHQLAMERTVFRVEVAPRVSEGDGRTVLGATGIDQIEFLISPNVGEELRPLTRIASGGETSRVMLALKTVLAQIDEVPTLLFDEIDTGIGGRTAVTVGEKLRRLAETRQVLCITHLAQIASLADTHFLVSKHVQDERTVVHIAQLSEEERPQEIARMLAGEATEATLANARELLARVHRLG